jgi:hypothetical protein
VVRGYDADGASASAGEVARANHEGEAGNAGYENGNSQGGDQNVSIF